jgi:phosphatidylserine/phosphatidylglycerophosphate/cardiolipin synthase-like enzyme
VGKNIHFEEGCIFDKQGDPDPASLPMGVPVVKLMVQPEDGIEPIVEALDRAKKSIQILIFRIDRSEVERALMAAVERGVSVQALVAYTNRGGDKGLRRFEMKLLEKGVTVTRTADDLVRYHGKMIIIDGKELLLLAFNFSHLDITLSRSFGVSTKEPRIVAEAMRLFQSDVKRIPYKAGNDDFVVSPVNARDRLARFIQGARKQLLVYDMKVSDREFLRLLNEKVSQGVDVRVIGQTSAPGRSLCTRALPLRLHARAILRDGRSAFLGSQSLRKLELEVRREIGLIFHDAKVVKRMIQVFNRDWSSAAPAELSNMGLTILDAPAKRVAKVVAKRLNVASKIEQVLDKAIEAGSDIPFEAREIVETVREALREEVHDAVANAMRELMAEVAESAAAITPPVERDVKKKVA